MEACLASFFFPLSSSNWRGYEAWAASYLCHMALSQWRGSSSLMDSNL